MTVREFWRLVEREILRLRSHDPETGEAEAEGRDGAVFRVLPQVPGMRVVEGMSSGPAAW